MENAEGVEKLFFELASESRIGILRELQKSNLKMQEVARKLDLTDTEAFRQLQRLSEAMLVQKQPNGKYAVTQFAKLEMQLSCSMDFVFKHKEYFAGHNIWLLPTQFIERIGELSEASPIMEALESISRAEKIMHGAEIFNWGIGEGKITESMGVTAQIQSAKGVKFRILSPFPPARQLNIENRTLSPTPVFMVLTEKEAMVCFRFNDGRMDYAGFIGKEERFLGWAEDLFLYYWNKRSQN